MKIFKKIAAICICGAVLAVPALSACGGGGDAGEITFWYKAGATESKIIKEMVSVYNEGQGKKDGVSVKVENRQKIDKSSLMVNAPNVIAVEDENFKSWAVEDLFHDMTEYLNSDPASYSEAEIPASTTNRFRLDKKETNGKIMAGEGADVQGLPFGTTAMVYYYSRDAFASQKINIISVEEEKLDGTGTYAKVKPHGYAEYKNEPYAGAEKSTNLAGEEVYKVFNNRVPMNWEEYRHLAKMLTKSYNSSSPTTYGATQHWWFSYGWSVGGDCIGYDGSKYSFTVADKTPNYLVTAKDGADINGKHYNAGEIVSYEDKIKTADISSKDGLYKIPSQYDALLEFCRTSTPTNKVTDGEIYGYGISTSVDDNSASSLLNGTTALMASDSSTVTSLEATFKDNYDLAPALQWKKYDDDNGVYYKGGTDFAHEYLKVIGETYDGTEFTGDIMKDGETLIQGVQACYSKTNALVIPERSNPDSYEASWKFIRWAASEEAQTIYMKSGNVPNQTSLAFSDAYTQSVEDKNYWAFANGALYGGIGDWSYFENGKWVNNWEGLFNNQLRAGYYTITNFMDEKAKDANSDIGTVNIIFNGRK